MSNTSIEVVGTGCATCQQLYDIVKKANSEIDSGSKVEYISNQEGMKRLLELGLMQSPALVVNDKVALVGYSPSIQKIKSLIIENS